MKKALIEITSYSLGDTIASMPYINKFSEIYEYETYVKINPNLNFLFLKSYPNLNFVSETTEDFDKTLKLTYFNTKKNIQEEFANQLGFIDWKYIRPIVYTPQGEKKINKKYISAGIHSTAQLKYWNNPLGKDYQNVSPYWTQLFKKIKKKGYLPVVVEKDEMFGIPPHRNGMPSSCVKKLGNPLEESMSYIYHSEFFIGLSSGLAWLAHAMGKPVVMISNFTEDYSEFDLSLSDYIRITNKSVCHGCWNKMKSINDFDPSDWYWCPEHKDTSRQFECHYSITPDYVYEQIEPWLK